MKNQTNFREKMKLTEPYLAFGWTTDPLLDSLFEKRGIPKPHKTTLIRNAKGELFNLEYCEIIIEYIKLQELYIERKKKLEAELNFIEKLK
jgi:hypothetical protein